MAVVRILSPRLSNLKAIAWETDLRLDVRPGVALRLGTYPELIRVVGHGRR